MSKGKGRYRVSRYNILKANERNARRKARHNYNRKAYDGSEGAGGNT
jgi:hypothetical protein